MFLHLLDKGWFIFYVVNSIGHKDAVNVRKRKCIVDKIKPKRLNFYFIRDFNFKVLDFFVYCINFSTISQQICQCIGEDSTSTSQVSPGSILDLIGYSG